MAQQKRGVLSEVAQKLKAEYRKNSAPIQALDCFVAAGAAAACVQAVYLAVCGTFPFNAFLAGILCCCGFSVSTCAHFHSSCALPPPHLAIAHLLSTGPCLAVCLRMQIDPRSEEFKEVTRERAVAEYIAWNALLFVTAFNFIG